MSTAKKDRRHGIVWRTWSRFRHERLAMAALIFLVIVILAGILSPWISPYDPAELGVGPRLTTPSRDYLLGTDNLGRDIFSRILQGAYVSMRFSLLAVTGALLVAIPLGMFSGYRGRVTDLVLMRIADAVMAIPGLVLAIALVAVLGPSLSSATIAIGVAMLPGFTRLVRGQSLAVREETFIEASSSIGTPTAKVLGRHIFPNILPPLVVQASIAFGTVLLAEASLSFLGLGAQPPTASWGSMLQDANGFLLTNPWQVMPPGLAITFSVLAFTLVGDGIRTALGAGQIVRKYGRHGLTTVDRKSAVPDAATPSAVVGPSRTPEVRPEVEPLLVVRDLAVGFSAPGGEVNVVDGVSFSVSAGETIGLVGESGSGKTVTSLAIMRLLPSPPAVVRRGSVLFDGRDLLTLGFEEMSQLRGNDLAMIFQDPMSSLNPSMTIVKQIGQVARWHEGVSRSVARQRALEALQHVGVSAKRADSYPHEFSGGMRQRAMIAMALVCRPKLLIADEPTTALDVTIQAQVLELLRELRTELGMAMIFVTHDLGVVAEICDRVEVMYSGQIVASSPVSEFFRSPCHPYAEALLRAMPQRAERRAKLHTIPGQVPRFDQLGIGCRFASRCDYVTPECESQPIPLLEFEPGRQSRCIHLDQLEHASTGAGAK